MRTWSLGTASGGAALVHETVAHIVAAIGNEDFSQRVLQQVNRVLPVGCWSVYRVGNAHPQMYLAGTYRRKDTTAGSWQAYLSGPHLADRTFALEHFDPARPALTHLTADEIPTKAHRDMVYRQFDMSERVSIVEPAPASVFALNLYRYNDQGHFSDRELQAVSSMAPPLLAAVHRHLALRPRQAGTSGRPLTVESVRAVFAAHRPDLTERELDVVARTVLGMSYEGIAADLGLRLPTVKTYRNRAFDSLEIHFRSELLRYYLTLTGGA